MHRGLRQQSPARADIRPTSACPSRSASKSSIRRSLGSGRCRRAASQQDLAHPGIGVDVFCEPAKGVEAGRQRHRALERDCAMRSAQADQPAEAGGAADRAARVGADLRYRPVRLPPLLPSPRRSRRSPGRGAAGFTGSGKWAFWPISEKVSSSVWVRPTNRAPASNSFFCRAGAVLSAMGASASFCGLPPPVFWPAMS